MKKVIVIVLAVTMLASISGVALANSTTTVYANDQTGWETAVGMWETEDFADTTLNPGVSVNATWTNAAITGGLWYDRLVCPGAYDYETNQTGPTTTTWSFATPITAFGGTWNPGVPGGPGAAIAVSMDGASWTYIGEIPETYVNQFWGFVSDVPFNQVLLGPGSECNGAWCETYEMDDLVYSYGIVDIDIKPMSYPNSINLKSKGVIPVAILGSADFDVTIVDGTSVMFAGASPAHDMSDPLVVADHQHDANGDGYIDFVFHFRTQETNIAAGDTEATLTGMTLGGMYISGTDSVRTLHEKP